MRILHCIASMSGGGAERQLAYLAPHQARNGLEVHVALRARGAHYQSLIDGGVHVHDVSGSGNYDPRIAMRMLRVVRKVQPDIVQTWMTQMDVFGGIAATLTRRPWILCERSSAAHYPDVFKNRARLLLAKRASVIVSNSAAGDDYWRTRASRRTERRVIQNAVPFDEIDASAPVELPDARPVILFVGRFSPEKNLFTIIEALRQTVAAVDAQLVFCGEGPLRAEVLAAIEAAGLTDRTTMAGFVSNVSSWLKRASVLVSAGFYEGNPNAVLEAAAANCPVVISDIPSHRELFDESSALFAAPESPEQIASALIATLRDRDAARQRAARARRSIEKLSIDAIAEEYTSLYRELLASRGGRS